jgi:hypothetical protein
VAVFGGCSYSRYYSIMSRRCAPRIVLGREPFASSSNLFQRVSSGPATSATPSVLAMVLRAFLWFVGEEGVKFKNKMLYRFIPYLGLYMARVKASAPGPELILALVEAGKEMSSELCNHPKATAIRSEFIERLLEAGWFSTGIEFIRNATH